MKKARLTYFQVLPTGTVDHDAGTIKGVSVLSIGPALGHGITIDEEGLKQCLAACERRGNVKLIDRHDAEFDGIVGSLSNFRIEGDQVRADAALLDTHPMRARVLEIATKLASEFGLSIECDGNHADNPDGKGKLFRCTDVDAVALVPRPAANKSGLFSARKFDTKPKTATRTKMSKLKTALANFVKALNLEEGDQLDNVLDAIVEAVQEQQPSVEDRLKKLEEATAPKAEPTEEEKAKLESDEKAAADEKAKADEDKMTALAEKIADSKITKFTAEIGIRRAPGSGAGFVATNDSKTSFETAIKTQLEAGAKDRPTAIARLAKDKPEIYNDARAKGLF